MVVETRRHRVTWRGLTTFGLFVFGALVAPRAVSSIACSSRPGDCAIVSTSKGPTWGEAVIQVSDMAGGFTLTLVENGHSLTLRWRPAGGGEPEACAATSDCPTAPPFDCAGATICGRQLETAYCGSLLSGDTAEIRFRWCRSEAEPWPPWPKPQPAPPKPPPPKPPKGKGVEPPPDDRRDPPGPPRPDDEEATILERIRSANAVDRPWQANGKLTTRKGLPSAIAARYADGVTWFSTAVASEVPTEAVLDRGGRMVARRGSSGPFLEIRPDPATAPSPGGGYEPTTSTETAPNPGRPKKTSGLNEIPGPRALVGTLTAERTQYFGLETCAGSVFAGELCHRIDFPDDGEIQSAYFDDETLLLDSLLGADRNGPKKIVWKHDPSVAVHFPPSGQIRSLTGDAAGDMAALRALLAEP